MEKILKKKKKKEKKPECIFVSGQHITAIQAPACLVSPEVF